MTTPDALATPLARLDHLISDLEAIALGEAYADAVDQARAEIDSQRALVTDEIFPRVLEPCDAGVLADLRLLLEGTTRAADLATAHEMALGGGYSELALALRSPRVEARLLAIDAVRNRPAGTSLADFQRRVIGQLALRSMCWPHSVAALELDGYAARVEAAITRHQHHAEAEAARRAAEDEAAAQVLAAAERVQLEALAQQIERLPGSTVAFSLLADGTPRQLVPSQAAHLLRAPGTAPAVVTAIRDQAAALLAGFKAAAEAV
jgi:hypothetical protein